jgi:hypothetical protein
MTRCARESTFGGIVSPICLAVFRIDHELKLRRLFDRQVGGLGALENLVRVAGWSRLATIPSLTGSETPWKTMGTILVTAGELYQSRRQQR